MDNYLTNITQGTTAIQANLSVNKTTSERPIIDAKSEKNVTQSSQDAIDKVGDFVGITEETYTPKAVKVRKYQLYKKRE